MGADIYIDMIELVPNIEVFGEQWELTHMFQQFVDINESKIRHSYYNNSRTNPYVSEVKHAINERFYVGIYYEESAESDIVKSGFRLIEPYAYGLGYVHPQTGNVSYPDRQYLRAYVVMDTENDSAAKTKFHTKRSSVSLTNREPFFRLFRLDRITSWFAFPKRFSRYRPLYNPDDRMMRRVLTSNAYDKFPYGALQESKTTNEGLIKNIHQGAFDGYEYEYKGIKYVIWKSDDSRSKTWYFESDFLKDNLTEREYSRSHDTRAQAIDSAKQGIDKILDRGITEQKINEDTNIQTLELLKPEIAAATQKVYNAWEQDEEGIDEMYGAGGICDDVASAICDVINRHNIGFDCTTLYNEYDYHTSVYAYNTEEKVCYHVDIHPFNYETGAAYTWKKIPNVTFTENMVDIEQVDYSDYIDDEGNWLHEAKLNESIDSDMDIAITIPKSTSWEDYQKEIAAVEDGSEVMNFKVTNFPTKTSVGSKCYLVYDGKVMGYMFITGMSEKSFVCSTTGTPWEGKFIERSGKFYPVEPIEMPGFRGFRYFNLEDYARK